MQIGIIATQLGQISCGPSSSRQRPDKGLSRRLSLHAPLTSLSTLPPRTREFRAFFPARGCDLISRGLRQKKKIKQLEADRSCDGRAAPRDSFFFPNANQITRVSDFQSWNCARSILNASQMQRVTPRRGKEKFRVCWFLIHRSASSCYTIGGAKQSRMIYVPWELRCFCESDRQGCTKADVDHFSINELWTSLQCWD